MLSYAFQVLNEQGYKSLATEDFHNVADLCAAILAKGISNQIKRGLGREYLPETEALSTLRGKVDIAESIKTQSLLKQQLVCTYDDFSANSYMNRIIKTTMEMLLHADIAKAKSMKIHFSTETNKKYEINNELNIPTNQNLISRYVFIYFIGFKALSF